MTKKKNVLMRSAGLLLVLVLVTSCFVGSTFAKYTVGGRGDDTARVAKFGVTVTANGSTFAKEYATDDKSAGAIANSVASTENVVAPGTKKEGFVAATITGTPEVAVRVSYKLDAADLTIENWNLADGSFYCPLVFRIKAADGGNTVISGTGFTDVNEMKAALVNAVAAYTKDYAPGTDLSGQAADTLTISWEWPFETGTDTEKPANNVKDTYLGDQAAAGHAATVSLTLATTVTQID